MTDKIKASRFALFRYLTVIVPALIGLIFAVVGAGLLLAQTWDPATGTLGPCATRLARTASNTSTVEHTCRVDWQVGGVAHSGTVTFSGSDGPATGEAVALRVSGDNVALAGPAWIGPASLAVGLLILTFAGYRFIRLRRSSTSD
jgi:hypothetical protein